MLIEAQAQKLISEHEKLKGDEESTNPLSMDIDEAERKDFVNSDVEMNEPGEKPPEEPDKTGEADDKAINIDPKTYCKLGHFHLLLEDYAKGKCRTSNSY